MRLPPDARPLCAGGKSRVGSPCRQQSKNLFRQSSPTSLGEARWTRLHTKPIQEFRPGHFCGQKQGPIALRPFAGPTIRPVPRRGLPDRAGHVAIRRYRGFATCPRRVAEWQIGETISRRGCSYGFCTPEWRPEIARWQERRGKGSSKFQAPTSRQTSTKKFQSGSIEVWTFRRAGSRLFGLVVSQFCGEARQYTFEFRMQLEQFGSVI